jgi:hypothetical protein
MRTVPENAGIDRVENLVGNIEVTVGVPYKDSKNVVTRENIEVTVGVPYKLRTRRMSLREIRNAHGSVRMSLREIMILGSVLLYVLL